MLINGQPSEFVPAADRGLMYGDGLFETIRLRRGRPVLLEQHLERLRHSCEALGIPLQSQLLQDEIESIIHDAEPESILKIVITRGPGGRGYRPPETAAPTRILQLHPLPVPAADPGELARTAQEGIHVMLCRHRLSMNSGLAGLKHLNRLDQVLGSMELLAASQEEIPVVEGLMCDQQGFLIEGTRSNLFGVFDGRLWTPTLRHSGVAGIMRQYLLEAAKSMGIDCDISERRPEALSEAGEVFICNSVFGLWPVKSLQGGATFRQWPVGRITRRLQEYSRKNLDL